MSDQKTETGHSFLIPPHRRLTWDLMRLHQQVPLCAHDRICDLSPVAEVRDHLKIRISWPALMLKAFGKMAQEFKEFRQIWYRWPIAHLYQHPHSVAALTVQRTYGDQPWVFWGLIDCPEQLSLPDLQARLDGFRDGPIRPQFRDFVRLSKLPTILRRCFWGWYSSVAKARRTKRMGTFLLTTLSGRGAEIQLPLSVQTGCLTYGPLDESGRCRMTIAYDHRVMDGALVADALLFLENTLNGIIKEELVGLGAS